MESQKPFSLCKVWAYCFALSLGSFQFGYGLGLYNPLSKVLMKIYNSECGNCWDLDTHKEPMNTLVSTIMYVGAFLGSILAQFFLRKRRNYAVYSFSFFCMIGAALSLIINLPTLMVGRFIHGFGAGGFSNLIPIMINEISPPQIRGSTGVLIQIIINFGISVAAILGLGLPHKANDVHKDDPIWRIMTGVPIAIGLLMIFLFITVYRYDTPYIYLKSQNRESARKALMLVYTYRGAQHRLNQMQDDFENQAKLLQNSSPGGKSNPNSLSSNVTKALVVCAIFSAFQQLTGMNAITFYASQIFQSKGDIYDIFQGIKITLMTTSVNLVFTIISTFFIDRFGRKPLLYLGYLIMIIFIFLTGLFLYLDQNTLEQIAVLIYIAGFALSMGPILWAYLPEVVNSSGVALAAVMNWLFVIIISVGTPTLAKLDSGMFFVFTGLNILGFLFVIFFIVQSKGRTRPQIQQIYAGGKKRFSTVLSAASDGITSN